MVKKRRAHPRTPTPAAGAPRDSGLMLALACVGLVAAVLAVYGRTIRHGFVTFDDPIYVLENPFVRSGLTPHGIVWALTTTACANWHPLTWISLMLDATLWGTNPTGYHLTNLILHAANSVLLFVALRRLTGFTWRSLFVAGLFAIHPLHVESVAWVAERKDVLSGFFWMLGLSGYARYVEQPRWTRYALVVLVLALGLMAKPMLVSLPIIFLLLDWWPLDRWKLGRRLITEKTPLFALSAASCAMTIWAQRGGGATVSLESFPIDMRLANASVAYAVYLAKTVWPVSLSFFYPSVGSWTALEIVGAAALAAVLTVIALAQRRRRQFVMVGWLWYLIALIPVIGLVQVGAQSMADRYTYLPLIGVFVLITWAMSDIIKAGWYRIAAAVLIIGLLAARSWGQAGYWRDDDSLCSRAIELQPDNRFAENTLGTSLAKQGRLREAEEHLNKALELSPGYAQAHNNLGNVLRELGRYDEAEHHYEEAIRARPDYAEAHGNLGSLYCVTGATDKAVSEFSQALEISPQLAGVHSSLGIVLARKGELGPAASHLEEALRIDPDYEPAHSALAAVKYQRGDYAGAWSEIRWIRAHGFIPSPKLVRLLSGKMPEPPR